MEKFIIDVPGDIRYISEWQGFNLSMFPDKCIINKQLPGCGFTEYLLRSNENIIVPVPRKVLGKNKYEQHEGEVYLVRNEMDKDISTDKDISKEVKDYSKVPTEEELQKQIQEREKKNNEIYQRLYNEIIEYITIRRNNNLPSKILVTYDSYRIVYQILNSLGIFYNFYVVVDEFQSILHDSRFKSTTENQFLRYLRQSSRTIFLSATPLLDEYLEMLSDFKDLPYYTLDWEKLNPGRIERPHLDPKTMRSVGTKAKEVLEDFLAGKYKFTVRPDGSVVYSTEIVFYVNSINHIISIIKNNNLTPEQVNIICAINDDNRKKIQKKLGKKFDIGSIPKKGEYHKPITLCTRTAYLGVDFYSTCASTYIFSDANIDSLAVDITDDLGQILGRQRDINNPWHNCATLFYRTTADYRKMTVEDFKEVIKRKQKTTEDLLLSYNSSPTNSSKYSLANAYQTLAKTQNYKSDYVGVDAVVNDITGDKILVPHVNELVYVNELRAFRIQQIDYADRLTLFSTVHDTIETYDNSINQDAKKILREYESLTDVQDKYKLLCESPYPEEVIKIVVNQLHDSDPVKGNYSSLGPQKLKALGYKKINIQKALGIVTFDATILVNEIENNFHVGDKIFLSDVKTRLANIYNLVGYDKTPKAKDLENYFEVKESGMRAVVNGEKKIVRYYEILRKK